MGEFSIFHWLMVVALLLFLGRRISEAMRDINRRGGPPTHPIPATGPIETSRPPKTSQQPWQALTPPPPDFDAVLDAVVVDQLHDTVPLF